MSQILDCDYLPCYNAECLWITRPTKKPKLQSYTYYTYIRQSITKKLLDSHPLIYKPLFGSQGKNIKKISNISDIDTISNDTNVYYLQEFLETSPSHDYRVLVTKSKNKDKTHTMIRYGDSYINNYSKGGKCVEIKFDSDLTDIALSAAKILDIPFCGVDIIKYNNKNYVIEVNLPLK